MDNISEPEEFPVEQIMDRRADGETVYYYVRKRTPLGDLYEWEPRERLSCQESLITDFEEEYKKNRKQKKKQYKENLPKEKVKKSTKAKLFPCLACATDSPWDPNRSFRGSLCDFSWKLLVTFYEGKKLRISQLFIGSVLLYDCKKTERTVLNF